MYCLLVADERVAELVLRKVLGTVGNIVLQSPLVQLLDLPDFDVARRLGLLLVLRLVFEVLTVLVLIVEIEALHGILHLGQVVSTFAS